MTARDPHGLSGPASSRIYDFSIGGKDNFSPDREVALAALDAFPAARLIPREGRKFLRRSVRYLLGQGIRQFLDIGCGLPGNGNVHQVVHGVDEDGVIAYVDIDPVAVVHFQSLLHAVPNAVAVRADARRPDEIIGHPEITRLIDFDRPVGVLMFVVLCHLTDEEDPQRTARAFREAMAPGSMLALCDLTDESLTAEERAAAGDMLTRLMPGMRIPFRSHEYIAGYFEGLEMVEPGLVAAPEWRPDRPYDPPTGWMLGGVGRKPL